MAKFFLSDPDGNRLPAVYGEPSLCEVVLDPDEVRYHRKMLGDISHRLLMLALAVNPEVRDELWDSLTESDKFDVIALTPDDPEDAALMVKLAVHELVSDEYEEVV